MSRRAEWKDTNEMTLSPGRIVWQACIPFSVTCRAGQLRPISSRIDRICRVSRNTIFMPGLEEIPLMLLLYFQCSLRTVPVLLPIF